MSFTPFGCLIIGPKVQTIIISQPASLPVSPSIYFKPQKIPRSSLCQRCHPICPFSWPPTAKRPLNSTHTVNATSHAAFMSTSATETPPGCLILAQKSTFYMTWNVILCPFFTLLFASLSCVGEGLDDPTFSLGHPNVDWGRGTENVHAQCGPIGKMAITQNTWGQTSSISGLVKMVHLSHVLTTL